LNFCTFPEPVSGKRSTISTYLGTLKLAIFPRANACTSSALSASPSRGITKAMTASPMIGSGTPTIETSSTFGWRRKKSSISAG